jgi:hypothetical protein
MRKPIQVKIGPPAYYGPPAHLTSVKNDLSKPTMGKSLELEIPPLPSAPLFPSLPHLTLSLIEQLTKQTIWPPPTSSSNLGPLYSEESTEAEIQFTYIGSGEYKTGWKLTGQRSGCRDYRCQTRLKEGHGSLHGRVYLPC